MTPERIPDEQSLAERSSTKHSMKVVSREVIIHPYFSGPAEDEFVLVLLHDRRDGALLWYEYIRLAFVSITSGSEHDSYSHLVVACCEY